MTPTSTQVERMTTPNSVATLRILIAEDGADCAESMAMLLRMDGHEVWRYIRRVRPDMKIIVSSGFDEVEALKQFTEATGLEFIQKPYTATALVRKIRAALDPRPLRA